MQIFTFQIKKYIFEKIGMCLKKQSSHFAKKTAGCRMRDAGYQELNATLRKRNVQNLIGIGEM